MKNLGGELTQSSPDFVLFVSDLHLCASRPHITADFLNFLKTTVSQAHSLYILGDLFEYWAGDDDMDDPHTQSIIIALRTLAESGVNIFLMHGNRDFLIGEAFCQAARVSLLQDPTVVSLYEKKVLLSHGDALCTDDVVYQKFRLQVRDAGWKAAFLKQPLAARKQQIEHIRQRSELDKMQKSAEIMDINQLALARYLKSFDWPEVIIHGHTHRPNEHHLILEGHHITRWVLGDWYEQGSYLMCDQFRCKVGRL